MTMSGIFRRGVPVVTGTNRAKGLFFTTNVDQGLLQYLAVCSPALVWHNFHRWYRNLLTSVSHTEEVVQNTLWTRLSRNSSISKSTRKGCPIIILGKRDAKCSDFSLVFINSILR